MNSESPITRTELARLNRNAAWRWGGLVVGLLGLQIVLGVYAVRMATGDPSVAVIPDYYARALDWDKSKSLHAESDSLGWKVEYVLGASASASTGLAEDARSLKLKIVNADGRPVSLAAGTIQMYPHSRANRVLAVDVAQLLEAIEGGGQHSQDLVIANCFHTGGLWEIELDLQDSMGQRFVRNHTLDLDKDDVLPKPLDNLKQTP